MFSDAACASARLDSRARKLNNSSNKSCKSKTTASKWPGNSKKDSTGNHTERKPLEVMSKAAASPGTRFEIKTGNNKWTSIYYLKHAEPRNHIVGPNGRETLHTCLKPSAIQGSSLLPPLMPHPFKLHGPPKGCKRWWPSGQLIAMFRSSPTPPLAREPCGVVQGVSLSDDSLYGGLGP